MAIEYTDLFHSKAPQNLPKLGFLVLEYKYHLATQLASYASNLGLML
jgi:hypothetical protein